MAMSLKSLRSAEKKNVTVLTITVCPFCGSRNIYRMKNSAVCGHCASTVPTR
jgi:ribosomal protein L37AE/L43A